MGWWDTWTTAKDTVSGWGKSAWNNASLTGAVNGMANFTYNTISRVLEGVPAALRLTRAAFSVIPEETKEKLSHVAKGGGRIIIEDAIPLAVISYFYQILAQQGQDYLEDNPDEAWLSPNTALSMGLWLLWGVHWIYSARKQTQLTVRTTILALEAGGAFKSIRQTPPMDLCVQKKCTTLRFLKGSFRDLIKYWSTKAAIVFVGYVPVVGEGLAAAFDVYHNGRYVTTLVLSELCEPDQERYLREYPELALANGIMHYVLSKFVCSMIEYYSGIPAVFYESTVRQFLLISQIGIASQMTLPPAVEDSQRNIPDPIAAYESAIGFVVDTTALGLKKKIPEMLKKQTVPVIPWEKIPAYAQVAWNNPVSENVIKPLLIPRMLRNEKAFINDPVIPWLPLQERILAAIKNIEDVKAHPLTTAALLSPSITAEIARPIFGTPKAVVELLLNLMKNEEVMLKLGTFRNYIAGLCPGELPPLPEQSDAFLLGGQTHEMATFSAAITNERESSILLSPDHIMSPSRKFSPRIVEITEEVKEKKNTESNQYLTGPGAVSLDPSMVIKRRPVSGRSKQFFLQSSEGKLLPENTIRQKTNTSNLHY
ncbi:hypothetical protein [Legionella clemsonensis]|uniref:Uncharacterized protein n=1 Tax=Legionella clemsonensis TaxID=1867846 RepID=A0A222P6H7_9GAMM|nr:hypothetical protein [Legionella clemsonensis]ASQ47375.1 hypothetical protein clem_14245 [Legionella clemsonensis]